MKTIGKIQKSNRKLFPNFSSIIHFQLNSDAYDIFDELHGDNHKWDTEDGWHEIVNIDGKFYAIHWFEYSNIDTDFNLIEIEPIPELIDEYYQFVLKRTLYINTQEAKKNIASIKLGTPYVTENYTIKWELHVETGQPKEAGKWSLVLHTGGTGIKISDQQAVDLITANLEKNNEK